MELPFCSCYDIVFPIWTPPSLHCRLFQLTLRLLHLLRLPLFLHCYLPDPCCVHLYVCYTYIPLPCRLDYVTPSYVVHILTFLPHTLRLRICCYTTATHGVAYSTHCRYLGYVADTHVHTLRIYLPRTHARLLPPTRCHTLRWVAPTYTLLRHAFTLTLPLRCYAVVYTHCLPYTPLPVAHLPTFVLFHRTPARLVTYLHSVRILPTLYLRLPYTHLPLLHRYCDVTTRIHLLDTPPVLHTIPTHCSVPDGLACVHSHFVTTRVSWVIYDAFPFTLPAPFAVTALPLYALPRATRCLAATHATFSRYTRLPFRTLRVYTACLYYRIPVYLRSSHTHLFCRMPTFVACCCTFYVAGAFVTLLLRCADSTFLFVTFVAGLPFVGLHALLPHVTTRTGCACRLRGYILAFYYTVPTFTVTGSCRTCCTARLNTHRATPLLRALPTTFTFTTTVTVDPFVTVVYCTARVTRYYVTVYAGSVCYAVVTLYRLYLY